MITATCGANGEPTFLSTVSGIAIYLDNWAIKTFAMDDSPLRQRFITTLHGGADLLFSMGHAFEILGPQGASSNAFKNFLNEVGPHWYPVELDVFKIMNRESSGLRRSACCLDEEQLTAYFRSRTGQHVRGSGLVIDLSEKFFRLGEFIQWLRPQRDEFRTLFDGLDKGIQERVQQLRHKLKKDSHWLDRVLPAPPFDSVKPATSAFYWLMRDMILDRGYQVKKGDGIDFFHAVVASAFANFATLDKHWKRRVEKLPQRPWLPRIYYQPQLSTMVSDIEMALEQLKALRRAH